MSAHSENPSSGTPASGPPAPVMRCVIWHAGGRELPGELLSSLSKRVGRMTICTSAYVALAESCLIERSRRVEIAAGSRNPGGGVVVLVQPAQLVGVGRLMDNLHLYAPSLAAWMFDRGANPKLRAVVEDDVTAWLAGQVQVASPTPPPAPRAQVIAPPVVRPAAAGPSPAQAQPRHRIGDSPSHGSNGATPAPDRPRRAASLLTEDELRMLLSPDAEDGGGMGQPPLGPRRGPQRPGGAA